MSIACAGRFVAGVGLDASKGGFTGGCVGQAAAHDGGRRREGGCVQGTCLDHLPGPAGGGPGDVCVLRVADGIGYRPDNAARRLARGRSRTLGVMFTVRRTFQLDLIAGLYPEADASATTSCCLRPHTAGKRPRRSRPCCVWPLRSGDPARRRRRLPRRTRTSYGHRLDQSPMPHARVDFVHSAEGKGAATGLESQCLRGSLNLPKRGECVRSCSHSHPVGDLGFPRRVPHGAWPCSRSVPRPSL